MSKRKSEKPASRAGTLPNHDRLRQILTDDALKLAAAGDIDTLATLDDHGLLLGPEETVEDYCRRLQELRDNIGEFDEQLAKESAIDFYGVRLDRQSVIPLDIFHSCASTTRGLYDFNIDWVPGFFTNDRMGVLFAGCAMYSYNDFFAVFVVRRAFQRAEKWLIYSRTELISHELCHIAHIGYRSRTFEEMFAYQTADSLFRRVIGGMLRSPLDTYAIGGTVILLFVAQVVNIFTRAPEDYYSFPMPLFFALPAIALSWVFTRYLISWRTFQRARRNLAAVVGERASLPVLFRSADAEIGEIAKHRGEALHRWLHEQTELRWQIIRKKYPATST